MHVWKQLYFFKTLPSMHIYLSPHHEVIKLSVSISYLNNNSFNRPTERLVDYDCLMDVPACKHLNVPLHHYDQSSVCSTHVVNVCGQLPRSNDVEAAGIKPLGPRGILCSSTVGMKRT